MVGALFLDRDGVINEDCDYCHRVDQFVWIPGIFDTVRKANELGMPVFIITNQAGIARGFYSESDFHSLTAWMLDRFESEGTRIAGVYFSPYHVDGKPPYNVPSELRKPRPGMLLKAAVEHGVDLSKSLLIGDQESDVLAGRAARLHRIALFAPGGAVDVITAADDILRNHGEAASWLERWRSA